MTGKLDRDDDKYNGKYGVLRDWHAFLYFFICAGGFFVITPEVFCCRQIPPGFFMQIFKISILSTMEYQHLNDL